MDTVAPQCPFAADATSLVDPGLYSRGTPHALWAQMRRSSPVTRQSLPDGREFWSVTSFRDAAEVLQNAAVFSSQRGTLLDQLGRDDPAGGVQLVVTDPPRHTALRMPLQQALAAKPMIGMRERFRKIVIDALEVFADGQVHDLAEHMRRLAMGVMGALMDLPAEDWSRLTELSMASIAPEDPLFRRSGAAGSSLGETHRELLVFFHDVVRHRRAHLGDDLVSLLIGTDWDGRPLNQREVVSNCYSLLLGGNVTISQVPTSTLADLMGTSTLERWAADPSLLGSGVEEALRWATPNTHFLRYAVRDTELRGQRINAGDAVVVWLASANRDEDAFPDPDTFDVRRRPNRHLAFGLGPHYCVGNSVVRDTLKLFFAELFSRFTDLGQAGPGVRLHSHTISGWASLPITARQRVPRGQAAY